MLTEEIKRMERDHPGKVITGYGTCKFCGQQAACKILEHWTEEEENEAATESCECPEAKWYTAKKEQKERARNRIIMLFGESNGVVSCGETVMELLNNIADEICEGRIATQHLGVMGTTTKGMCFMTCTTARTAAKAMRLTITIINIVRNADRQLIGIIQRDNKMTLRRSFT